MVVTRIVNKIYQRDPLSAISNAHQELHNLLYTKRALNESFTNFESRFSAQLSKVNAIGSSISIVDSMAAFIMLSNADLDNNQRISVLSAGAPRQDQFTDMDDDDKFIRSIQYKAFASVIKQCDQKDSEKPAYAQALSANAGNSSRGVGLPSRFHQSKLQNTDQRRSNWNQYSKQHSNNKFSPNRQRDIEDRQKRLQNMRNTMPCRFCGNYGHWWDAHQDDGSLPSHIPSSDVPIEKHEDKSQNQHHQSNSADTKSSITFNMAHIKSFKKCAAIEERECQEISAHAPSRSDNIGPMVDNGAPYSAIGILDLLLLSSNILPSFEGSLDPVPDAFKAFNGWQYGSGDHASEPRPILGSILLTATVKDGSSVSIRHLVLSGSSQWVIGRNVTSHGQIDRMDTNSLVLPKSNQY